MKMVAAQCNRTPKPVDSVLKAAQMMTEAGIEDVSLDK